MIEATLPKTNEEILKESWERLSPNAQRMMTYIANKAYRQSFSIEDLCKAAGLERSESKSEERLRETVMATLLELRNNGFWVYEKNEKWCTVSWLAKAIVDPQHGIAWAWVDENIRPYLPLFAEASAN